MNKFIRWLKFNPPRVATLEAWHDFKAEFKEKAPIRYFISETIRKLRFKIYAVTRRVKDRVLFFIDPPNIVRTELSGKMDSHSLHDLALHSAFTVLKDHVEIKMAIEQTEIKDIRWKGFFYFLNYSTKLGHRRPDLGISHLVDEIEHARMWDIDRANTLEKALKLYLWWTVTRRTRKLPAAPYSASTGIFSTKDPELKEQIISHSDIISKYYRQWEDEDSQRLLELVVVLKDLH